jgi:hypothetical protein
MNAVFDDVGAGELIGEKANLNGLTDDQQVSGLGQLEIFLKKRRQALMYNGLAALSFFAATQK